MPAIPDEAVQLVAERMLRRYESGSFPSRLTWRDFADDARADLEAAAPILADGLREHIDNDHGVMVQLGRIADHALSMLEHVNMDTDEDRALHARAVGALRGRLGEIAATMREADGEPGIRL